MKTAISVPDAIFKAGERLARRMRVTRSRLYSVALREYVETHDDEITRRLNEVYGTESSEVDSRYRQDCSALTSTRDMEIARGEIWWADLPDAVDF